jgi:hypothetical protein
MDGGELSRETEETIRQRMGWGALDKDLILFTEDENVTMLSAIIGQWPDMGRRILLWPTFGNGALLSGQALQKLQTSLKIKVAVHRDRDFMSDDDIHHWKIKKGYDEAEIPVWMTPGSDIESSFCTREAIANALALPLAEAEEIIAQALDLIDEEQSEREFNAAITSATVAIPLDQRSVPTIRWRELGGFSENTVKGKVLLKAIESAVRERWAGTNNAPRLAHLRKLRSPSAGHSICWCIKEMLEPLLRGVTMPQHVD